RRLFLARTGAAVRPHLVHLDRALSRILVGTASAGAAHGRDSDARRRHRIRSCTTSDGIARGAAYREAHTARSRNRNRRRGRTERPALADRPGGSRGGRAGEPFHSDAGADCAAPRRRTPRSWSIGFVDRRTDATASPSDARRLRLCTTWVLSRYRRRRLCDLAGEDRGG